jgi:hyaluronoglucosaminidase
LRGVIEGFYGPQWTHEARTHVIEFLARRGMNAYVYAPKDDPKHRERWRDPYDAAELREFAALAACCERASTRLGFAISPGLDIDDASAADRAALLAKVEPMLDAGISWIVLAVDDIPSREGLATEQVALMTWLVHEVATRCHGVRWSLVPTEYVGTRPSAYLTTLATGLPDDVDVFWTGPTVCSPTITAADARAWRDAIGGRPLLLWDNYPVNDAVMERELHLGPYRGRDADLTDELDGVLCNPMLQARASLVALATAAEYLEDPVRYCESDAWERAIDDVGGSQAPALRAIARACCDGPLASSSELPAHALVEELARAPAARAAIGALRRELDELRAADDAFADDDVLGVELAPWLAQARREADAGIAALRLLELLSSDEATDEPRDAERLMISCFVLLFAWSAARDAPPRVVLGPRFAMHPAVVQLEDGAPALDVALAVREDQSVVDRIARLALDAYARSIS